MSAAPELTVLLLTMNEEDVIRNANEATTSAWRRMHQQFPDIPVPEAVKL